MNDFIRPIDEPEQSYDCPSLTGETKKEVPMPNLEAEIEDVIKTSEMAHELQNKYFGDIRCELQAKKHGISTIEQVEKWLAVDIKELKDALLSLINKEIAEAKKEAMEIVERVLKLDNALWEGYLRKDKELKLGFVNSAELRGGKK